MFQSHILTEQGGMYEIEFLAVIHIGVITDGINLDDWLMGFDSQVRRYDSVINHTGCDSTP